VGAAVRHSPRALGESDSGGREKASGGNRVIEGVTRGMRGLLALTRAAAGILLIASVAINFINMHGSFSTFYRNSC
jgi:hypothetical protein